MNDAQRALLKRILASRHFVNAESLKRTLQFRKALSRPLTKMPVSPDLIVSRPCSICPMP